MNPMSHTDAGPEESITTVVEKRVGTSVIRRRRREETPVEAAPPDAVGASAESAAVAAVTEPAQPTTSVAAGAVPSPLAKVAVTAKPGLPAGAARPGAPLVIGSVEAEGPETSLAERVQTAPRRRRSRAEWEEEDIRRAGGLFNYAEERVHDLDEAGLPTVDPEASLAETPAPIAPELEAAAAAPEPVAAVVPAKAPEPVPVAIPEKAPILRQFSTPVERVFRPTGGRRRRPVRKGAGKKTQITEIKASKRFVRIEESITVGDLSQAIGVSAKDLLRQLIELGMMATINQSLDIETATLLVQEHGYEITHTALQESQLLAEVQGDTMTGDLRPPVVTVMGHVDHGKTSLLDAIRATDVTAGEAGGITQHIGASEISTPKGMITFIDTPGHEAFTALRARGAQVTDLVVLVVAADDGVMPQTIEALHHAKAAEVPIIVAINKMDKPEANPERVKRELAEHGVVTEEWGGEAMCIGTSAKSKAGIDELLEAILLQAEVLELKADPKAPASGVVLEARLDKGRGPVATVLIQNGTLRRGAPIVCGAIAGRVRALVDAHGQPIEAVTPGCAAEILGLEGMPTAGDPMLEATDERAAKVVAEARLRKQRESQRTKTVRVSLEDLQQHLASGEVKTLNVIIKGDVQGSVEAVVASLERLSTDKVKVDILHQGVGGITESDVLLAAASAAIIIGFNVRPEAKGRRVAEVEGVEIKSYSIIYELIDDLRKAMTGLLEPTRTEHFQGRAEVREIFTVSKIGTIAGCRVVEGKVARAHHARLLRDSKVVFEGKLASLKRFKDDAREVLEGFECGMGFEGFQDIKPGDVIETYTVEETAAVL